MSFEAFNLPDSVIKNLKFMGIKTPTPIQDQAIPFALNGRDILGSAQTGTGKTAAFAIPAIVHVLNNEKSNVLILTPTRELATQVLDQVKKMMGQLKIATALLIGGDSFEKQLRQLKSRPRIVVGTPGRINDHLEQKTLNLSNTDFLVMDETDRMLDMGFVVQLDEILPKLASERQTLMFSATFSKEILRIAADYLSSPERISVGSTTEPTENIAQETIETTDSEKYQLLTKLVAKSEGSFIVFVKTKRDTEKLMDRLDLDGHQADAIHGDLKQSRRDRVIARFRSKRTRILVATDVAARGLDIPHIECVVNYDIPHCPEDYIHRIGRTGRAGAKGLAVSFITGADRNRWRSICKLLDPNFKDDRKFEADPRKSRRRPRKSFDGAKGESRFGGESRFRSDKSEGPRRDRSDRSDRKSFSGERPAYAERSDRSDRSDRSNRTERPQNAERSERRSRPERADRPFSERKSSEGRSSERKFSEGRSSEGRSFGKTSKPKEKRFFEKSSGPRQRQSA